MAVVHIAIADVIVEIEIVTAEAGFTTNNIKIGASSPTLETSLNITNTPTLVFFIQGSSNNALNTLVFKLS